MKAAISITEQEIRWHKENKDEAPAPANADSFIKGMAHLLDLFQQAEATDKECGFCGYDNIGPQLCPQCRHEI